MGPSRNSSPALFVTLEGMEGVGKSTQAQALADLFRGRGLKVLTTREPGGTPIGNRIRDILLNTGEDPIPATTELFLVEAARAQHVHEVLQAALRDHDLVLCDRFADASVAYQGAGRGLDLSWVRSLNERACEGIRPDLTVILDMPVEAALQRAFRRISRSTGRKEDRFEREDVEFHRRVREAYLALARAEPSRVFVVDATQEIPAVTRIVAERVDRSLKR